MDLALAEGIAAAARDEVPVGAVIVLGSVSFPITDPDVWQHLAVGRALWADGRVPVEHQTAWPVLGRPEPAPSWAFRALLWPFWLAGGA